MRHLCAILLAASLLSCGVGEIECEVSVSTNVQRADVQTAIDKWATVARQPIVLVDRAEWLITTAPIRDGIDGYTEHRRRLVRVRPDVPATEFYAVVFHEIGHVYGLHHSCRAPDAPGGVWNERTCAPGHSFGVMDPTARDEEFSADDLRQCREVDC